MSSGLVAQPGIAERQPEQPEDEPDPEKVLHCASPSVRSAQIGPPPYGSETGFRAAAYGLRRFSVPRCCPHSSGEPSCLSGVSSAPSAGFSLEMPVGSVAVSPGSSRSSASGPALLALFLSLPRLRGLFREDELRRRRRVAAAFANQPLELIADPQPRQVRVDVAEMLAGERPADIVQRPATPLPGKLERALDDVVGAQRATAGGSAASIFGLRARRSYSSAMPRCARATALSSQVFAISRSCTARRER